MTLTIFLYGEQFLRKFMSHLSFM